MYNIKKMSYTSKSKFQLELFIKHKTFMHFSSYKTKCKSQGNSSLMLNNNILFTIYHLTDRCASEEGVQHHDPAARGREEDG